jgi:archaellum component FlaC
MGLFRNNTKRMIQEFRDKSEYYANDLGKDIKESFEDLKVEFEEHNHAYKDFVEFVSEIKSKLSTIEAKKLEELSDGLKHINHCAKNGVESMRVLSVYQRKHTNDTLRLYEEFE